MSSNIETIVELSSQDCAEDDLRYVSLNQLYVEQCLFSIPKDEVTRIQHAVEIMVLFLLTSIYESTSFTDFVCSSKAVKQAVSTFKVPPRIPYEFNNKTLLKVGSYYENTKNHYPDEFDFICVIAECRGNDYGQMKDVTSAMADIFHICLQQAVLKPFLAGTCIEFVRYVRLHGPASTLEFRKKDETCIEKSIFVDISPASKVYVQSELQFELNNAVRYPEWQTMTQATGSFLLLKVFSAGHPKHETKVKVSITETEQHYVLTEMSEKHKQAYRLLKYILNNDSVGEELRKLMRSYGNQVRVVCCRVFYPRVVYDFPSYVIKTLMFHHCRHCNSSSQTVSDCVLDVLDYILKLFNKPEQKRKLFCFCPLPRPFSVLVETITGDMIEIADNYESSLKIKKFLKTIQTDIENNRVTERISLANKIVPVVIKHRIKRNYRKKAVQRWFNRLVYMSAFALLVSFFIVFNSRHQVRLCWNGTDYVGDLNYTSSFQSNISHSFSVMHSNVKGKAAAGVTVENTYCIEYKTNGVHEQRPGTSMGSVRRIYYCGNRSFCTAEDKLYRIKLGKEVIKAGFEQELVCSAIEFESRLENDYVYLPSENYQNGTRLACFQKETSCLNMKRKNFYIGLPSTEEEISCDKNKTCSQNFPPEVTIYGCYISQHVKTEDGATQTEMCCCDSYKCVDPEKDQEELKARTYYISIVLCYIFTTLFCCCGCCCLYSRFLK